MSGVNDFVGLKYWLEGKMSFSICSRVVICDYLNKRLNEKGAKVRGGLAVDSLLSWLEPKVDIGTGLWCYKG